MYGHRRSKTKFRIFPELIDKRHKRIHTKKVVVIEKQQEFSVRYLCAIVSRHSLERILFVTDVPNSGIATKAFFYPCFRIVWRTVVHYDNLKRNVLLHQHARHAVTNHRGAVESRNYDGNVNLHC